MCNVRSTGGQGLMPQNPFTDRPGDRCGKCGKRTQLLFHQEGTGRMICLDCEREDSGHSKRKVMR